jgi:hypothetical protein
MTFVIFVFMLSWSPILPIRIAIWSLNVFVVVVTLSAFWPTGLRWEFPNSGPQRLDILRASRTRADIISGIGCGVFFAIDLGVNVLGFEWAERAVAPIFLCCVWVVSKVLLVQVVTDWRARIGERSVNKSS